MCHSIKRGRWGRYSEGRRKNALGYNWYKIVVIIKDGVELLRRIDGQKVCKKTSHVRGCHRCTRQSWSGVFTTYIRRNNVESRSKYVNARSVVREIGTLIAESGGTNGNCFCRRSRRVIASITIVVTCNEEKSVSIFECLGNTYQQRQRSVSPT